MTMLRLCRILGLGILLMSIACQTTSARRYYALSPAPVLPEDTPLPMTVWLRSVEVGPTYNRPQIVYRYSQHELQYFANRLWADRPERMLKDTIYRNFSDSNLFERFQDRIAETAPSHILTATVDSIEERVGVGMNYAHLTMTLRLITYDTEEEVWRYRIDESRPIPLDNTEALVRALSDLLDQELAQARQDLRRTLNPKERPRREDAEIAGTLKDKILGLTDDEPLPYSREELAALIKEGVTIPHRSDWMDTLQYNADSTILPEGMAAIFIPALSGDGSREPTVRLHPGRATESAESLFEDAEAGVTGQTGTRILVEPGIYTVLLGSGSINQRLSKEVLAVEGRVTVLEPTWSALDVQVLDSRFVAQREAYEVFRMNQQGFYGTGQGSDAGMDERGYFGTGFGANAELGEQTRVWLLEPGLYKIVQPGANYRARTNFATVYLLEGGPTRFNLVMDTETGDFLGAGVVQQGGEEVAPVDVSPEPWQLSLSFGGDVLLAQSSASVGVQQGTSMNISLFADGLAQYSLGPHRWISRGELEEGQIRQREKGFRTQTDRLYFHSIYIYDLNEFFGPYARIGAETSILDRTYYLDVEEPEDIIVLDPTGVETDILEDQLSFQLAPAFSPLNLREGVGVNFQVLRTQPLELNARLGVGARQFIVGDPGYVLTPITEDLELVAVQQVTGTRLVGAEMVLLGTARIGRYVQLRSEFDALVPNPVRDTYFKWRTIAGVRLSSFASLNYRLELTRDTNQSTEQPLAINNIIQLQFFYKPL